jgi:hypothetical protein
MRARDDGGRWIGRVPSKGRAISSRAELGSFAALIPLWAMKNAPARAGALRGRHMMTDVLHFGSAPYFVAGSCFQKAMPPACCATSTVATLARAFRS